MATAEQPTYPVYIKKIGNSTYKISNTKKDPEKGKWYVHEFYNNGNRMLSGNTVHFNAIQTALGVFDNITKEMEIVIHTLCKAEQERIKQSWAAAGEI